MLSTRMLCCVTACLGAILMLATPPTYSQIKLGDWVSLGGEIQGAPALTSTQTKAGGDQYTNHLNLLAARGKDDALWWRQRSGDADWSPWQSAGGIILGPPVCASRKVGIIDCFFISKDHTLVERSFVGGAWNAWSAPNNNLIITGDIAVFAPDADHITVLAGGGWEKQEAGIYRLDWASYASTTPQGFGSWKPMKFNTNAIGLRRLACDGIYKEGKRGEPTHDNQLAKKYSGELSSLEACLTPFLRTTPSIHFEAWETPKVAPLSAGRIIFVLRKFAPAASAEVHNSGGGSFATTRVSLFRSGSLSAN